MKLQRKLLVVPAVFVAACTPSQPTVCDPNTTGYNCKPDGGYWCGNECFPETRDDGGVYVDDAGMAQCLC